ncbi:hypothetical protein GA0061083_0023 [Pseudarthrobacter enclensis]|nr:hypothetical protein GA0061083_0023 [Pseudarthrobacter enclensis]
MPATPGPATSTSGQNHEARIRTLEASFSLSPRHGQFMPATTELFSQGNVGEPWFCSKQWDQVIQRGRSIHEVCNRDNHDISELLHERIHGHSTAHLGVKKDGPRKITSYQPIWPCKINCPNDIRFFGPETECAKVFRAERSLGHCWIPAEIEIEASAAPRRLLQIQYLILVCKSHAEPIAPALAKTTFLENHSERCLDRLRFVHGNKSRSFHASAMNTLRLNPQGCQ